MHITTNSQVESLNRCNLMSAIAAVFAADRFSFVTAVSKVITRGAQFELTLTPPTKAAFAKSITVIKRLISKL